ncbi:MAG TPA: RIP metalloprotease RseP [Myxococcota bacterium]|nr:RIP metalloprotease RseP [Myxococcota bacterium]
MNLVAIFDWLMPFVLLLGVLVFIHELGHFAVAKWLGVKVEKFSLGFGPSLLARRYGETEYVVAALPLGGFVKMLGELPGEELDPAEAARAFNTRPIWQRIAIALAGPAMNLVLPVFLIAALLMSGVPTLTSRIGGVVPGSPADQAGLREGDRVTAVNGEKLWRWQDLEDKLQAPGPAQVTLGIERPGTAAIDVALPREKADGGGWKDTGVSFRAPVARVAVPNASSPAALAGLRTGDRIAAIDGVTVANLYALRRALETAKLPLGIEAARPLEGETQIVRVTVRELAQKPSLEALGLVPIGVSVMSVEATSPAKQAGLEPKDVILAIGDQPATDPEQVKKAVLASGGKPLALRLLRGERILDAQVVPVERATPTPGGGSETRFGVGIFLDSESVGAEYKDEVVRNPFVAVARGAERTGRLFSAIVGGVAQLLSGHVGMNNLSGPIGIGEIAAEAYQDSWSQFVLFMAMISVNLAILNLLPIPVLDGGQIVLAAAEGIKGSPLPARARDVAQTIGLSLILLLMGVAFWNDIARHWSGVVSFLSEKLG